VALTHSTGKQQQSAYQCSTSGGGVGWQSRHAARRSKTFVVGNIGILICCSCKEDGEELARSEGCHISGIRSAERFISEPRHSPCSPPVVFQWRQVAAAARPPSLATAHPVIQGVSGSYSTGLQRRNRCVSHRGYDNSTHGVLHTSHHAFTGGIHVDSELLRLSQAVSCACSRLVFGKLSEILSALHAPSTVSGPKP
jgi:hypothetical protein